MPAKPFLRLSEVSKTYPGVAALSRVSLQVRPGEVIGLVGENGAGKSTLMKILGGVVAPSSGSIHVDETAFDALTVADALAAGIAFVHQELNLFENLDAAANAFIGREPLVGGVLKLVDRRKLHALARPCFERLGVDFEPDALVSDLSLAQRQLLEIAKALSLNSRLVIMDEPTSSLTLAETERLLRVIADLKARGVSVIFITHRLNELTECADRVVVLRDGRVVGELSKHEISHAAMIRLMIGRDLKALYLPPAAPPGAAALEIVEARTRLHPAQAVTLTLRRGEILGLAGLIGAGRTELVRALFGIDRLVAGSVRLDGEGVEFATPRDAIARGVFLVPEDRKRCGLLLDESICANIVLPSLRQCSGGGLVRRARALEIARRLQQRLGIRAPSLTVEAGTLSGGNQQKVVLAKWLAMNPRVLICDEPTRGIDVGAKSEIYRMLRDLADAGVAILMISSDMEEVIGVSDRIAVMHAGGISGVLERAEFSEQSVLRLAVGARCH
ncbi:MAG: sugar ABC transporter ATP-binding protein [Piscinibacter sp.]|nr:sugar ABC transporter ATP-binding protein [Piscinibacter sp.]